MFKFFKKLFRPFAKIPSALGLKLRALFNREIDDALLEEMERLFYEADLGGELAYELTQKVKKFATKKTAPEEILQFIKQELLSLFPNSNSTFDESRESKSKFLTESDTAPKTLPKVVLLVGVNGSGKTTTLAKLASYYKKEGKKVLIAAGDTFRAAAVEQLETWSQKVGIPIVKSKSGSDPSSVAFDAIDAAIARKADLVLIDTAGRLQTKTDLMQELEKIKRVIQKKISDAPHETLLVLDATVGQNAIDQARVFHQFTPISGIVLTKLDGSAKGGIAIPIQKELKIPIQWIGIGEKEEDLLPFDAEPYIDALLNLSE